MTAILDFFFFKTMVLSHYHNRLFFLFLSSSPFSSLSPSFYVSLSPVLSSVSPSLYPSSSFSLSTFFFMSILLLLSASPTFCPFFYPPPLCLQSPFSSFRMSVIMTLHYFLLFNIPWFSFIF